MKQNCTKIIIFFTVFLLGFMGCSSTPTVLTGRYVRSDADMYYDFAENGTYSFTDMVYEDNTTGTYSIEDGKVTFDDDPFTTLYIIENYLCMAYDDDSLPKDYSNTTLSRTALNHEIVSLKEDGTFTYEIIIDNLVVDSFKGTYTINQNKIICTSETNATYPFFEYDGQVYFIAYTKE